jgi:hypothetical protein
MGISLKDYMTKTGILELNATSNIDGGEGPPKTPYAFTDDEDDEGKKKRGIAAQGKISSEEGGHKKPDVFDYVLVEEITKEDVNERRKMIQTEVSKLTKLGKTIDIARLGRFIRREQASLFFDLFKKRNVWMT